MRQHPLRQLPHPLPNIPLTLRLNLQLRQLLLPIPILPLNLANQLIDTLDIAHQLRDLDLEQFESLGGAVGELFGFGLG